MRVALIHYWLFHMRGGEKVLEALCEMFPQADIFTHVYDPRLLSDAIRSHRVRTTFIQRLPMARTQYKKYLPFMPAALEALDLSEYDLVISSEAGPAKGVIVRPDAMHICYCHSPMRYIWDQYHNYYRNAGLMERTMMPLMMPGLRQWDITAAARVDHFVANSNIVADRIQKYWRRDSDVVAPPVDVDRFKPAKTRDDFYLYVGQLVPYKRAELAVAACTALNRNLVVIGEGSEMARIKKMAGPTVEFIGKAGDSILEEFYAHCRALIFPTEEDFGIVPVEAMASGAPVIAYGRGGARDTVIDGETGIFFSEQTLASTIEGIVRFEMMEDQFDSTRIANHAQNFRREVFKKEMMRIVNMVAERKRRTPRQGGRPPLSAVMTRAAEEKVIMQRFSPAVEQ